MKQKYTVEALKLWRSTRSGCCGYFKVIVERNGHTEVTATPQKPQLVLSAGSAHVAT
jgi:hypothetical protein